MQWARLCCPAASAMLRGSSARNGAISLALPPDAVSDAKKSTTSHAASQGSRSTTSVAASKGAASSDHACPCIFNPCQAALPTGLLLQETTPATCTEIPESHRTHRLKVAGSMCHGARVQCDRATARMPGILAAGTALPPAAGVHASFLDGAAMRDTFWEGVEFGQCEAAGPADCCCEQKKA